MKRNNIHISCGLTLAAVLGAVSMSMGCADGVKLSAQQKQVHEQVDEMYDRAYRCAPRELALARAHEEFGRMELSDGNGRRGEDHVTFAVEKAKEADEKSLDVRCQDPKFQDRDKDGIIDSEDLCPDTPGIREFKGCPNPDPDHDSVCDPWVSEMNLQNEFSCKGIDMCPKEKGELAHMGCPNPDSDGDGVCDPWVSEKNLLAEFSQCTGSDKCPFEKGTIEENGCPPPRKYIVVTETQIELKEQFFFATNKTKVLAKSEPLLNEIADVLKENPTIKISIEGHTDSTGRYKSNVKLSQGRAKSVMQELIKRGIAKDRLQYAGYGPDKPIDTNDTPEGRANNRRVELRITER